MIPFDTLCEAWRAERAYRLARFRRALAIGDAGLVIGPLSLVARKAVDRFGSPHLAIDGAERRILALLSVAYWRAVDASAIGQLRRASVAFSRGNRAQAAILFAHIGLPRLDEDERIGFRLFAAEKLLDAGVAPRELMKGLGLDARPLDHFAAYNPDQPRVLAGQSGGGQWVGENGDRQSSEPTSTDQQSRDDASQSPKSDILEVSRPDLEALAKDPKVAAAIDQAWSASKPGTDFGSAREQGFFIVRNSDGTIAIANFMGNSGSTPVNVQTGQPPEGAIAWFHTHPITINTPFPNTDLVAASGPSRADAILSEKWNLPGILKGSDGLHYFNPPLRDPTNRDRK
jgi:hypothetical protein